MFSETKYKLSEITYLEKQVNKKRRGRSFLILIN